MLERLNSWGTEADLFSVSEAGPDSALLISRDLLGQSPVLLERQEPLLLLLHQLNVPAHLIKTGPVIQAINYISETRAANVTVEQVDDDVLEIEAWLFEEDLTRTALNMAFSEVMVVRRILAKRLEALGVRGENASHASSHRSSHGTGGSGVRRARRSADLQPPPVKVSLHDDQSVATAARAFPPEPAPAVRQSESAEVSEPPRPVAEAMPPSPERESASEAADREPATAAVHKDPASEAGLTEPASEAVHTQPASEAAHTEPATEAVHTEPASEAAHIKPVSETAHAESATEAGATEAAHAAPATIALGEASREQAAAQHAEEVARWDQSKPDPAASQPEESSSFESASQEREPAGGGRP